VPLRTATSSLAPLGAPSETTVGALLVLPYDTNTIEKFNVDSKAEYSALSTCADIRTLRGIRPPQWSSHRGKGKCPSVRCINVSVSSGSAIYLD